MKNKILITIIIVLIAVGIVCGIVVYTNSTDSEKVSGAMKEISIMIYDKDNEEIFKKELRTEAQYLSDVLEETENLDIQMQDTEYGKYITSIQGISEGDDYYWSYYINDEYAEVGVSNCEIKEGDRYTFKIEKFEY